MPFAEFNNLLRRLPQHSRLSIAQHGEKARWDETKYLTADLIDVVQENTRVLRQVNGDKKAKKITPYPRPGQAKKETGRTTLTDDQIGRRLLHMKLGGGPRIAKE